MTFHWPWGRPWCAQRLWGPGPWLSLEHRLDRGHGGGQSLASGQLLGGLSWVLWVFHSWYLTSWGGFAGHKSQGSCEGQMPRAYCRQSER